MTNKKNIIILSCGRSGSHWVENIVLDLCGGQGYTKRVTGDITLLPDRWLAHTHNFSFFHGADLTNFEKSCILVHTRRKDHFARAVSDLVAEHTMEWFDYSDKPVVPFSVDHATWVEKYQAGPIMNLRFDVEVRPLYSHVVDICYEDLCGASNAEEFVAGKLGFTYAKTNGYMQSAAKPNPRNYKDIIINWSDLLEWTQQIRNRFHDMPTQ